MKYRLWGTTALATATLMSTGALAADPIKVTLSGYYQHYFVFGAWDKQPGGADGRTTSIRQEGEIHFNGITKLDNGTSVGFRIELEAYTTADQIDEHYIFASGDWGRLEFGATNGPMSKMAYGAPSALPGFGFISDNFNFQFGWATTNTAHTSAINDDRTSGDANKITYFTPRFAGLQVGVSYTPEFSASPVGIVSVNGNACGATGGASTAFGVCTKNDLGQYQHSVQLVANYLAQFNSVNLALFGGVFYAEPEVKGQSITISRWTGKADDWWHWLLGANLSWQGFSVGGNIGRDNNGQKGNVDTWMYTAAATYSTGPWTVGGGWRGFRRNLPNLKSDTSDKFEIGGNYLVGPGIRLAGGLLWNVVDGDIPTDRKDSIQLVLGSAISF